MRSPKQPRSETLDQISGVFRQHGYDGASLQRISQATGLGRASLYHHFPGGKEEMAREVFGRVGSSVSELMIAPLTGDGPPAERLAAWSRGVDRFYSKGDSNCLLGAMVLSGGGDLFARELAIAFQTQIDALTSVLQEADLPRPEARKRAESALAQIQGALIVSRGLNSRKHFQRILKDLPQSLLKT